MAQRGRSGRETQEEIEASLRKLGRREPRFSKTWMMILLILVGYPLVWWAEGSFSKKEKTPDEPELSEKEKLYRYWENLR